MIDILINLLTILGILVVGFMVLLVGSILLFFIAYFINVAIVAVKTFFKGGKNGRR